MKIIHIQKVDPVINDSAKMMRFRLNGGWDYVWVTYHEEKGFVSIASSFGSYAYIWSAMGANRVLTQFFCGADPQYLAGKFFSERRMEKHVFDSDLAFKELKRDICKGLRDGDITSHDARRYFDEVKDWEEMADGDNYSSERFYDAFYGNQILTEWQPDFWEANYGRKISGSYLVLQDEIIPMIQEEMRKGLPLEHNEL